MKKYTKYIIIAVVVIALIVGFNTLRKNKNRPDWRTDSLSRGPIREVVTASGSLNPYVLVEVGTEVSGKIDKLYKDFNDKVKKGDLLAKLDTEILRTSLEASKADLAKAQTSAEEAKLDMDNLRELVSKNMAAEYELQKAEFRYQQATHSLTTARLNKQRAQKNLDNAYITSPIDGVIVARSVDEGQTVAASLSSPTLFTIANNLDKMQITANIDEADIGRVKIGLPVEFSVDAYPAIPFAGEVKQIRLNPTTEQNVVSYSVIIDADNPGHLLLPGMTTNVTIIIQAKDNVQRIPEAATRFRPSKEIWTLFGFKWSDDLLMTAREKAMEELKKEMESQAPAPVAKAPEGKAPQGKAPEGKAPDGKAPQGRVPGSRRGMAAGAGTAGSPPAGMPNPAMGGMRRGGMSMVWVLRDGEPTAKMVRTGISDGAFMEVLGGIDEKDQLITGVNFKDAKQAAAANPMSGGPGMRRF
jgi:HlyD family secretion protein